MVKPEPSSPAAQNNGDAHEAPEDPQPDIEISFKDINTSQRTITVTHRTSSGGESKVTLEATVDSNAQVNCGDLQILIRKSNSVAGNISTSETPEGFVNINNIDPAPAQVDRKPALSTSTAPRPKAASPRRTAKSSSLAVSPKSLAIGRSAPKRTDKNKDAQLTVIVYNYKCDFVLIEAMRSERIADVLRRYACKEGLNYGSLSAYKGSKRIHPSTRFGTMVERYMDTCRLDVVDVDNLPDPDPYSEYDSDS